MKETVREYRFRDAFREMGRKDQFTYEGLGVLFEYLEAYEEDSGEELELDVVALCCDYYEDTAEDIAANYSIDLSDCDPEDDDAIRDTVRSYLEANTTVVGETSCGFVYSVF